MQTKPEQKPVANDQNQYVTPPPKPVYEFFKRVFDILFCSFALIVLSPVFLVVAIAVKCEDGGKIFFRRRVWIRKNRRRIGKNCWHTPSVSPIPPLKNMV